MKLKCLMCGKEFDGPSDAIHCPDCVKIIKNTHYHPRTCKSCGAHFLGGGRASYCPACRAERQKKQKAEYEARKRAGTVRRLGSIDHCAICGKPYTVEGGLQKYCPECAPAAVGTIALEQAREYAKKHFLERAESRKMARAEISCAICGKMFTPRGNAITCSAECSAKLAKKRRDEWRAAHKKYLAEKNKQWFAENKEYRAEYARRKRDRDNAKERGDEMC